MKKILQESDRERFCRMWRDGRSLEDMSKTFGIKPETIRKYARYKFNLPLRPRPCRHSILSDPKKVQFLKLNYSDMGDNVIAVMIGENPDWVRRTARRLGLEHSEQYRAEDYAYRAKKTSATRKENFARGLYPSTPRDAATGQFISKDKR